MAFRPFRVTSRGFSADPGLPGAVFLSVFVLVRGVSFGAISSVSASDPNGLAPEYVEGSSAIAEVVASKSRKLAR
jgi:hypothetical protein